MPIIIVDGVKKPKEGYRMPGVKKNHQESENSSKAEYIFGHLFAVTGVLIGNSTKKFCVPVIASIQNGVNLIRKWKDSSYKNKIHVEEIISEACNVESILGHSILLLDRYFENIIFKSTFKIQNFYETRFLEI